MDPRENMLPEAPGTGRSHPHGDMGEMQSLSERQYPGHRSIPKVSHPGPGNGSGMIDAGKPLRPKMGGM